MDQDTPHTQQDTSSTQQDSSDQDTPPTQRDSSDQDTPSTQQDSSDQDTTATQQDSFDQDTPPTQQDVLDTSQIRSTARPRRQGRLSLEVYPLVGVNLVSSVLSLPPSLTHSLPPSLSLSLPSSLPLSPSLSLQAVRNLVNRSREVAVQIFNDLDRRLKLADKKDQSGVIGRGRDSVPMKQKTKTKGKRQSDNQTAPKTVH